MPAALSAIARMADGGYRDALTLLDQAVLTDAANNIVFNLPQQDMVALRAVIRLGWQMPNPINRIRPTEAQRYPIGILVP